MILTKLSETIQSFIYNINNIYIRCSKYEAQSLSLDYTHHTPLFSCITGYQSVCIELLSFDYAQINLAIQPRSIDISPLYIHQQSTQRCCNSRCNINIRHDQKLCGQQPINQANCHGSRERERGRGKVIMTDQDLCCYCSAVSLLSSLCQGFYEMISQSLQTGCDTPRVCVYV